MRNVKLVGVTIVIALVASLGATFGSPSSSQAVPYDDYFTSTVGINPGAVAVSPDGTKTFVANKGNSSVSEVNAVTGDLLRTFSVGASPHALAVTADGTEVFVVNYMGNSVTEIRLSDGETNTFLVGHWPTSIAISPDNTVAYVTNSDSDTISVINITSDPESSWSNLGANVAVDGGPTAIALSPDGYTGYVTLEQSDELVSIDLTGPTFPIEKRINVGSNPTAVVVSSDAQGAFVANELDNTVSAVWLNQSITDPLDPDFEMRIDGTTPLGTAPNSLAFSPDMGHLYVTNFFDGTVSIMNTSSLLIEETLNVGTYVGGVAASPDGTKIFVTAMPDYSSPGTLKAINVASPMALTLHVTDTSAPYTLPIQDLWGTIAWGDGTFTSHWGMSNISHTYASTGNYLLTITGGATGYGDAIFAKKGKVTSVASWGDFASDPYFTTLDYAFSLEPELTALPADFPASVISAEYMFTGADRFNQDISTWDVSNLVNMRGMFFGTQTFDAPIGNWDISNATDVTNMFKEAYAFNQDLSNWHTNQLFYFDGMFEDAESFNQDLSSWSIQSLTSATNFLDGTAMSSLNYSKLLRAWSQQEVNPDVHLDAHNTMYYSSIDYFRDHLIDEFDWVIEDDGPTSIPPATLISAPTPSTINSGQRTQESSLTGGAASQPGTFSFTEPSAVLSSGIHNVGVTFTPDDPILFAPFTTTVSLNVRSAPVSASPEPGNLVGQDETPILAQFPEEIVLAESFRSPSPQASNMAPSKAGSQTEEEALPSSASAPAPAGQSPLLWLFAGAGFTLLLATGIFIRMRIRAKF
ncbi:BspA family leucine-rich repeat surface protein [uncultured Aurantimicrobium sp.]|uniref:BspA family leucine-rich repeat surface protein n=1 Tax=uncultured Aurantimicrobium sp. TaxID=1705357 RepID=UPI002627CFCC|nr:BspA family leucine-rich repeat surface protein [uncultured Aurantimicrobium sp.]